MPKTFWRRPNDFWLAFRGPGWQNTVIASGGRAMAGEASITGWLRRLAEGDRQAVAPLWQRYFHRLVNLARARLRDGPRRIADEEDVALSAMDSFCRGAEQGR